MMTKTDAKQGQLRIARGMARHDDDQIYLVMSPRKVSGSSYEYYECLVIRGEHMGMTFPWTARMVEADELLVDANDEESD